jgi:release factor glutamine methyltransferase
MTVTEALNEAVGRLTRAGIEEPRLEAEVLLARALETTRSRVLAAYRDDLVEPQRANFESLLLRRLEHEPLAYIVGHKEFYGTDIRCAPGALIPRPETEVLADVALGEVGRRGGAPWIADIGTRTGAVAIAVVMNAPTAHIVAVDRSEEAISVAGENVRRHGLCGRIGPLRGDLTKGVGAFDIVVANLPYVADAELTALAPEIRRHEPHVALHGGERGISLIERLLTEASAHLRRHVCSRRNSGPTRHRSCVAPPRTSSQALRRAL